MTLVGTKIIPVVLGLSGIAAGGSFSLTSYLTNKPNYVDSKENSLPSKQKEIDESDNTQDLSSSLSDLTDSEDEKLGIEGDRVEGNLETDISDSQLGEEIEDSFGWDNNSENTENQEIYEKAKSSSGIIAEYIYRDNEYDGDELRTFCDYWTKVDQISGTQMPDKDCQELENQEEKEKNKPIMWLRANKNDFQNIFPKYFYLSSGETIDPFENKGKEDARWTYGSNWSCITTEHLDKTVVSCEKTEVSSEAVTPVRRSFWDLSPEEQTFRSS
ncbi:hypothetical protein [Mycoplasma suis]|uniref:Uncharacterized protein n=1 Tax=Mycoplasma suis (strain Illinois) TaxID=768700 RepID=F0QQH3_MYCSL|nr:hypothetical protein [Mycoplasma suis]ADX97743.1 hypothetical protein MSU_0199 [Mycoplasma suis str. Illinois]